MRLIIIITLFSISSLSAQVWQDQLLEKNPNAGYQDKFEAFNDFKLNNKYTKGNGYNPYARNLDFVLERVSDNKDFPFDENNDTSYQATETSIVNLFYWNNTTITQIN